MLAKDPGRLREVDGIGPKRAAVIAENYASQLETRETMLLFAALSGAARAGDAHHQGLRRQYHHGAARQSLSDGADIPGVGFRTADRIAQSMAPP